MYPWNADGYPVFGRPLKDGPIALPPDETPSMTGKVYVFDQLSVHSERSMAPEAPTIVLRELIQGKLDTCLAINLHETDLGPNWI